MAFEAKVVVTGMKEPLSSGLTRFIAFSAAFTNLCQGNLRGVLQCCAIRERQIRMNSGPAGASSGTTADKPGDLLMMELEPIDDGHVIPWTLLQNFQQKVSEPSRNWE
jgi:hypothetical protein